MLHLESWLHSQHPKMAFHKGWQRDALALSLGTGKLYLPASLAVGSHVT